MPALLQEIVSVYPLLSPPNLTAHVSNRVCNALALLQCVASHSETRQLFLNGAFSHGYIPMALLNRSTSDRVAHIPLFLYPFLNTTSKTRPFEYLRLTSLGVIGALVKARHPIQLHRLQPAGLVLAHISLTLWSQSTAKRQLDRDSLPSFDGDNPALSAHYGDWL
jgi:hypothetical protein